METHVSLTHEGVDTFSGATPLDFLLQAAAAPETAVPDPPQPKPTDANDAADRLAIKKSEWTAAEDAELKGLVAQHTESGRWSKISAAMSTNRSPKQCLDRTFETALVGLIPAKARERAVIKKRSSRVAPRAARKGPKVTVGSRHATQVYSEDDLWAPRKQKNRPEPVAAPSPPPPKRSRSGDI